MKETKEETGWQKFGETCWVCLKAPESGEKVYRNDKKGGIHTDKKEEKKGGGQGTKIEGPRGDHQRTNLGGGGGIICKRMVDHGKWKGCQWEDRQKNKLAGVVSMKKKMYEENGVP